LKNTNAAHALRTQLRNYGADFFREGFGLKPPFEIPRSATALWHTQPA